MKILDWLFPRKPEAPPAPARDPMALRYDKLAEAMATMAHMGKPEPRRFPIQPPVLAPGVLPSGQRSCLAMDGVAGPSYAYANSYANWLGFPGYPYLAELTQRTEYRSPSETTANEMTRKWIRVTSTGDDDVSDKIRVIEAELKRHKVRDLFRWAALQDGYFGHSQIYIDVKPGGGGLRTDELRQLPLVVAPATIPKGSLVAFRAVEPLWTTPTAYNSNDPTAPDFYKPQSWFVMGKATHSSRLLSFMARPVTDLLKPAYNFGGMSLSQLLEPYVNNWLSTRDNVSALVANFSRSGLATNMGSILNGGNGQEIFARIALYNQMANNGGMLLTDKDSEEFFQFNTPLSSLDKLQAQAQEQMAGPAHVPLVKLLGITPAGLNANSDGEIRVWYDWIHSEQENLYRTPLDKVIKIIQLDQFGVIDDNITFEFEPLYQLDGKELAEVRKSDADAAAVYITAGVISAEEERQRLANDPESGYVGLDADEMPEPPPAPDPAGEVDPEADNAPDPEAKNR